MSRSKTVRPVNPNLEPLPEKPVPEDAIFVFGSNEAGFHGAGAALFAHKHKGATWGVGVGRTGDSYAIPTKDENIETLSLIDIAAFIFDFLEYAEANPELTFNVTRIGCGLAGYTDEEIAPMFETVPENCILDQRWRTIVDAMGQQDVVDLPNSSEIG